MSLRRFFSLNLSSLAAEPTTATDPRYGERLSCSSISSFLSARLLGVYYRVFFQDGAIPTLHPASSDDPFLGRVLATSITPPHNVDSLKRCLAKHEDIDHRRKIVILFLTRCSVSPMDDTSKINIVKLPDRIAEWGERPALVNLHDGTWCREKISLTFIISFF